MSWLRNVNITGEWTSMYTTSILVSDEVDSGKQTLSLLLSQARVAAVVDSKAS